jgi:DNA-binding response OmpR family regulator
MNASIVSSHTGAGESITESDIQILLVEDDSDLRELLADRLRAWGYRVDTTDLGSVALDLLQRNRYAGMVLDIGLPDIDGLEVLYRYREVNQDMPVIMITASESKPWALRAIGIGAQAFLLKPFGFDEFQLAIQRWFTARDQSDHTDHRPS